MIKSIVNKLYCSMFWSILPNGIYCFNYHRVGDKDNTPYDPNVFSCTENIFRQHVNFYNSEFTVISIEQLIELIDQNAVIGKKYAVITFDDGYIDNYEIAYKILKEHKTPAAFYIATKYIDEPHIPWWDAIAWLIKQTKVASIQLSNWQEKVDLTKGTVLEKIRTVLKIIKQDQTRTMDDKIIELANVCQCHMPEAVNDSPLFISWQQAKEMASNGMHIGSHTISHRILSHLSEQEQIQEINDSKAIIEHHLNIKTTSIAYPVGGLNSFTKETKRIAREAQYKIAFSYIPGVTRNIESLDKFSIKRLPVGENCSINELKSIILKNTRGN